MLITFKTDAYANVIMFGDVALKLLNMMGRSETVPSAMFTADVPVALARLTAALEDEQVPLPPDNDSDDEEDDGDESEPEEVSLRHRAKPLLELLAAAASAESSVMWE